MYIYFTGLLAVVAALAYLRRRAASRPGARALTDEAIRQIENHGVVEVDEPLDLRDVDAEERRFWDEETWDESDEW